MEGEYNFSEVSQKIMGPEEGDTSPISQPLVEVAGNNSTISKKKKRTTWACRKCNTSHPTALLLYQHRASVHGCSCQFCGLSFTSRKFLYHHYADIHHVLGTGISGCHYCLEIFPSRQQCDFHEHEYHKDILSTLPPGSKRRFCCPQCPRSYAERKQRDTHMRIHQNHCAPVHHISVSDCSPGQFEPEVVISEVPEFEQIVDCAPKYPLTYDPTMYNAKTEFFKQLGFDQ